MPSTRSVEGGPKRRTARFHVLVGLLGAAGALAFLAGPAAAADCRAAAAPSIDWQDCNKSNLILRESPLAGANLVGTDLSYSDLRNSDLTGADLEKATLTRASLAGSKADGAKFHRIEGYRTLFNEISATGSSFASAELQRADFTGAKLDGANFEKAELGRGVFTGASIGGVKFAFANLARARFDGATFSKPLELTGAFLFLTRLDGLDLSASTGLQQAQIDQACGDDKTKLPQGLKQPEGWPCSPMEEDE